MANWIEQWEKEKIPSCEKFGISAQRNGALKHAALVEDLLIIDG